MKKFLSLFAIAAFAICHSAQADTTNAPVTPHNFFTSAQDYLTSFNTNYTFEAVSLEVSTGYKQVTGVNAASFLDGQYDFANGFNIGASIQFSGVGSPINGAEAGIGYNIIRHYDAEVNAAILAGYDNVRNDYEAEPGLTLKKKLTTNTFAELGISLPIFFRGNFNTQPTFRVGTGFTF